MPGTHTRMLMRRPPFLRADGELVAKLQRGVATLRSLVVFWFRALLVTNGGAGILMLATGVALGASLHKAAYALGGVLALCYLLVFVLILDACEAVCAILELLSFTDASSREDILTQMDKCRKGPAARVLPEGDLDMRLQQIFNEIPDRLRSNLVKALHLAPAVAAAVSLCSLLCILYLNDIPAEVRFLPAVSTSLVAISAVCGLQLQVRASPLVRVLVQDTFGSPPYKLLEIHCFQLRKRLAATPEGHSISCLMHALKPSAGSVTVVTVEGWVWAVLYRALTGQAAARSKLAAAVKDPRSSILPAVEMGWLAGLSDEEVESEILQYLRAVARLCELSAINMAIQETSALLPKASLSEAVQARDRIQQLFERITQSTASMDLHDLRAVIKECEAAGWPSEALHPAIVTEQKIQDLLGRLSEATNGTRIEDLDAMIHECEAFGLPDRDLVEARATRESWKTLLLSLRMATERKDLDKLKEAIRAGQATSQPRSVHCKSAIRASLWHIPAQAMQMESSHLTLAIATRDHVQELLKDGRMLLKGQLGPPCSIIRLDLERIKPGWTVL